jgi:hypothetical protein
MTKQTGINEKNNELTILDRLEYELKQIWTKHNASQGETKAQLLKEYKMKHETYRQTKSRINMR